MSRGKRRYLLACCRTAGMWAADYRWAKMRSDEVTRRFAGSQTAGWDWWHRAGCKVTLKPKRGQKR